jgi:hypothetical protein
MTANESNAKQPTTASTAKKMQNELRQLQNFVRHGRDISKFEATLLPASLLKFVGDNLHKGTGVAFKEASDEIERSTDPVYTSTASAVARAVREMHGGTRTRSAAEASIAQTLGDSLAVSGGDVGFHVDELQSIASDIAKSVDTFGVLTALKQFHALVMAK